MAPDEIRTSGDSAVRVESASRSAVSASACCCHRLVARPSPKCNVSECRLPLSSKRVEPLPRAIFGFGNLSRSHLHYEGLAQEGILSLTIGRRIRGGDQDPLM